MYGISPTWAAIPPFLLSLGKCIVIIFRGVIGLDL
jgi:hypothetical protein